MVEYPVSFRARLTVSDGETVGYNFLFGSHLFSYNDINNKLDAVNDALEYVVKMVGYVVVSHIVALGSTTYGNAVNPIWRMNLLFPIISPLHSRDDERGREIYGRRPQYECAHRKAGQRDAKLGNLS